jgi:glutamate N-acetyltransferase/amino-acid N-acetyltransferase
VKTCAALAGHLGISARQVLPSSTGVIGVELDADLIVRALPGLCRKLSPNRFHDVAEAIMTTDLVPKTSFAEVGLQAGAVRIAGMTKGSGMIHPNMATMLAYIVTDAAMPPASVSAVLNKAVEASFNRISVDGDTSTNDTLVLMANGASGVRVRDREMPLMTEAVTKVAGHLAEQIARDGEGASKLITISVTGARTDSDAARIARAIANSPLVKTAVAGSDPNWGRILCAAGYSGAKFDPRKVDIALQGVTVCASGLAAEYDEPALKSLLAAKDCSIEFRIQGRGAGRCRFWTCDLTEGYIRINGSYRT